MLKYNTVLILQFKFLLRILLGRKLYNVVFYIKNHKKIPRLNPPVSFNEKLLYRKIYSDNELFVKCSDKYRVREYVESKVGNGILIPLLYVGPCVSENILKNFKCGVAVKYNHNSGEVLLIRNSDYDYSTNLKLLRGGRDVDFGASHGEWWYSAIKEKLVLVEQLLISESGQLAEDYKFHVFNYGKGDVYIQHDQGRSHGHVRNFYDEELNWLPMTKGVKSQRINWALSDEMTKALFKCARSLAEDFSYVRVDLYCVNNKIYFGELTFTPMAAHGSFSPREYDYIFGRSWEFSVEDC